MKHFIKEILASLIIVNATFWPLILVGLLALLVKGCG